MILYKYLSLENALKVIGAAKLRFSQPSVLNDPFEMRPTYASLGEAKGVEGHLTNENLRETAKQVFDEEMAKMPPEILGLIPPGFLDSFVREYTPFAREMAPKILDSFTPVISDEMYKNLDRLIGMLCLSEFNDNSLMWAHYADSHHGVVLGFDSESTFFEQRLNEEDDFRHLKPVCYTKERPRVQVIDIENGNEILYTKNEDWAYEGEWRMILPLKDASEEIQNENATVYLYSFPKNCLKEIIFGYKTSDKQRKDILALLQEDSGFNANNLRIELDPHDAKLRVLGL